MKRLKIFTLILAAIAFFVAGPAQAAYKDMWANVYKWEGKQSADGKPVLTRLTTGVTFQVLAIDTTTAETLYYYKGTTSLTNPVSTTNFASNTVCNDQVRFRVDPTDATNDRYVDLIVVDTNGGYTAFVENFDAFTHTIVIDERPNVMHHGMIWFDATTTDETDTGVNFLAESMIHDVRIEVITAASAATLDVGLLSTETSGDADGFIDGILLTNTGHVADTGVVTAGTTIDWTAASTYGALLYKSIAGSDAVASGGGRSYKGHIVTSGKAASLTYSQGSTSGAGLIHYFFTRLR